MSRLRRRSIWTNRSPLPSRRSSTTRSRSRSSRSAGDKVRMSIGCRRSKSSARPIRLRATPAATRTWTSSARYSPARPILSRSTCSAAANIRRPCPSISPSRRPGIRLPRLCPSLRSAQPSISSTRSSWSIGCRESASHFCRAIRTFGCRCSRSSTRLTTPARTAASILYGEDPIIPPLSPERLEWVKARLKPPG